MYYAYNILFITTNTTFATNTATTTAATTTTATVVTYVTTAALKTTVTPTPAIFNLDLMFNNAAPSCLVLPLCMENRFLFLCYSSFYCKII
jgi:hypothetical protein